MTELPLLKSNVTASTHDDDLQILLYSSEARCKKKRFDPSYSSVPKYLVLLTHLGLDLFQMGCYVDQICISVMMVINLKHLESSRAEALSLPCFKLTAQWGVLFSRECDDS